MPEGEIRLRPEIEALAVKLEKDPKSKVFAQLADAYRKSNMIDEAIEIAKKGLEIHPNYAAAHSVMGRCYLEKKIYSLAREEFERVASLDPHNVVALKLLADVHFTQGAKEEAIRRYRQVLDMDPLNVDAAEKLEQLLPPPPAPPPPPRAVMTPPVAVPVPEPSPPETALQPLTAVPEPEISSSEAPPSPPPQRPLIEPKPTFEVVGGRIERKGPLTGEEVASIVDQMFDEAVTPASRPAFPEPPAPPEEVPAPETAGAVAIPDVAPPPSETVPQPEAEVSAPPKEEAARLSPLEGEEVAEVVQSLLTDRQLSTPAIAPPEVPAMIEQKPAEALPVVETKGAPVPAKAKEVGATITLAELYEHQGFYDKALEMYEQVLAENPGDTRLQEKIQNLRSKTYWGEALEPEPPREEIAPVEKIRPAAEPIEIEVPVEVPPPVQVSPEPEPSAEPVAAETPPVAIKAEEKPVVAEPSPALSTPLFHPESAPKPEGQERGKEIKSFQEWLDSLKKPRE